MNLEKKFKNLKDIIASMKSIVLAYSGGVDSTFLLKVSVQSLPDKILAVTARSPSFPRRELEEAKGLAKKLGVRHRVIATEEMKDENFIKNGRNRCYWCKRELFLKLFDIAQKEGLSYVADGANCDDVSDYRPGRQAAKELGVRSPLSEAHLTKKEIRKLSYNLKLSTWRKPSFACLASRFPYGMEITERLLKKIDKAEDVLLKMGFTQVRVRHYGDTSRIEVSKDELAKLIEKKDFVVAQFKKMNYSYITLDLEGYRTGSMNQVLNMEKEDGKNIS